MELCCKSKKEKQKSRKNTLSIEFMIIQNIVSCKMMSCQFLNSHQIYQEMMTITNNTNNIFLINSVKFG